MSAAALAVFGNSPTALSKTRPPKLVRQTNGTIGTQLSLRHTLEPNITENLQADTRKINNWRAKKRNYPQTSTLAYTQVRLQCHGCSDYTDWDMRVDEPLGWYKAKDSKWYCKCCADYPYAIDHNIMLV